ncbi:effector-associated constant component EACC1 [Streptomyces sp. KR55]|uniref:effector-associated constant component EACC1 n=1 Tax=Streptomyces sp. KR55 TaxID=3457425 RepID=UPI003FD5292A
MDNVSLSVEGDDPVEGLAELSDWLGQEPELRGLVSRNSTPSPGELGTLTDALVVAVGSGGVLSVLGASLRSFLTLPRRSDVRVKVSKTPKGTTVEIDAKRVNDVEALIREALGRDG